jgi:uncharacterized protein
MSSKNTPKIQFDDVANKFVELKIHENPSALHGYLSAALVCGKSLKKEEVADKIEQLLALVDPMGKEHQDFFNVWFQAIHHSLADPMMSFKCLLPEEDQPLSQRMTALCLWAGHFISSFGEYFDTNDSEKLTEDVKEMLQDLATIAQSASEGDAFDQGRDDDEDDWETISDHVRLCVVNLWLELNPVKASTKPKAMRPDLH